MSCRAIAAYSPEPILLVRYLHTVGRLYNRLAEGKQPGWPPVWQTKTLMSFVMHSSPKTSLEVSCDGNRGLSKLPYKISAMNQCAVTNPWWKGACTWVSHKGHTLNQKHYTLYISRLYIYIHPVLFVWCFQPASRRRKREATRGNQRNHCENRQEK